MSRIWGTGQVRWVDEEIPHGFLQAILFGGDRLSCVDEAVAIENNDTVVGIATIAPEGEQMSGEPTIVGLYVRPEHRGKGAGMALLLAAIDRCRERGLVPVRVDALTTPVLRIAEKLPEEYRRDLRVSDHTLGGAFNSMFL